MPTLNSLRNGRKAQPGLVALPGPLAQLGLGRDGTYFVIAAGRAAHVGGSFKGTSGNLRFIGIEAENSGSPSDTWPLVQLEAYQRGVAAILKHLEKNPSFCSGHKEYAPGKKDNPSLNMRTFREAVGAFMAGAGRGRLHAASPDEG